MSGQGAAGRAGGVAGRWVRRAPWSAGVAVVTFAGFLTVPGSVLADGRAVAAGYGRSGDAPAWVRTWQAAAQPPASGTVLGRGLGAVTVRMRVHTSVGGRAVRLTLSNEYGTSPLRIAAVTVARPARVTGSSPDAEPGSVRAVTFAGAPGTTLAPHRRAVSDVTVLDVPSHGDLLVSVAYAGPARPLTGHLDAGSTTWVSVAGDWTTQVDATPFRRSFRSLTTLSALDVVPDDDGPVPAVVAFGDSITDGWRSTPDADLRWPDALADMLPAVAVANAGISSNRVLTANEAGGVAAAARLERDALTVPGVRVVVVLEGINDIRDGATAEAVTAGLADLGRRARARGLTVVLGTLTPFGRPGARVQPHREKVRRAVNAWILREAVRQGAADAVVDVASAVAAPGDTSAFAPVFDSGDHLHPGDAGYTRIAAAFEPAVRTALDGS